MALHRAVHIMTITYKIQNYFKFKNFDTLITINWSLKYLNARGLTNSELIFSSKFRVSCYTSNSNKLGARCIDVSFVNVCNEKLAQANKTFRTLKRIFRLFTNLLLSKFCFVELFVFNVTIMLDAQSFIRNRSLGGLDEETLSVKWSSTSL